jgi:hypothetical protein
LIGSYYMYSNMYIYVSHYLRNQAGNDMDFEGKKAQVVMPIWLIVQSCVSVLSVKIGEKIGFKTLNFIAFVWFTLNNLAMMFVKNYYLYVAVYGFSNGIACGLGYLPGLYTAWTYFPDKKSVATGLILFCAGMSASISSPLVTRIVNPDNVDPSEKQVWERVPYLFQCLTIGYGTITLLACSFQPPPHESSELKEKKSILKLRSFAGTKEQRENLDRRLNALGVKGAEAGDPHPNLTAKDVERVTKELFLREMGPGMAEDALLVGQLNNEEIENLIIVEEEEPERHGSGVGLLHKAPQNQNLLPGAPPKSKSLSGDQYYQLSKEIEQHSCPTFYYGFFSRSFLLLAIMAFSCAIYNYFLLTAWKALFKSYLEFSDSALANLLIVGACSNSSFRVIVGVLLLKFKFIYFYRTAVSVIIISAFTFDFVVISGGHELVGIVYLFFAFAGLGTMVTIFPTVCVKTFGPVVGSKLYPCIYVCFSTASLAAYLVYRNLKDPVQMFYIFGSFAILGLAVSLLFDPSPSWAAANLAHAKDTAQKQASKAPMLPDP